MKWRVLLGALLVYVVFDLSLPAMPGAFVFDAGDSVEGTHGGRVRLATGPAITPAMAGHVPMLSEPRAILPPRLPRVSHVVWQARAGKPSPPRAECARLPVSEDPH
ncbi:MAG TPA: hypothetical protein VJU81_11915 [Methylomirabilota bacterium]|nr:hypothetical protein [Methylomirabilota bacterium]